MTKSLLDHIRHTRSRLSLGWARKIERILYALSEYESIALRAGERQPWRRRYLKHKGIRHGRQFYIGRGFWIHDGRKFSMGDRCSLGEFARILDHGPVTIGDDFIAATGLQINSGSHDTETMEPIIEPVVIGNHVWCGANVTILSGVNIGDNVVIGAGSLVRNSIPSGSIAVGVPARVIRPLNRPTSPSWGLPKT